MNPPEQQTSNPVTTASSGPFLTDTTSEEQADKGVPLQQLHLIEGTGDGDHPHLLTPAVWQDRLREVPEAKPVTAESRIVVPRSPVTYAGKITFVSDVAGVLGVVDFVQQRPVSFIGFDTEFRYDRPPVQVTKNKTAFDPTSIHPFLLSLAVAEPGEDGGLIIYRFVIDLRVPGIQDVLAELLQLPICFVGHFIHVELLCLWKLGLPEPTQVWDTCIFEKASRLGLGHKKYKQKAGADEVEEAQAAQEAAEDEEFSNSLLATCQRYVVPHPFAGNKEQMQASFMTHPDGKAFSQVQIDYAAADAVAAASLYPLQVNQAMKSGLLHHMVTIEMPWVVTTARMAWRGVLKDPVLCRRVGQIAVEHSARIRQELAEQGLQNPDSHPQLVNFFTERGLIDLFYRNGKYSFDKEQLAEFRDCHPAIHRVEVVRKIDSLLRGKLLGDELIGTDGRVHPTYTQLGAHSGRQSSSGPNILGLGRVHRPLIIASPGRGLGEVDLSQIEIGIAAALYRDEHLVRMFNSGDVYSAMAVMFFAKDLSEEDRNLDSLVFKKKHSQLRSKMKTLTLAIIYGMTDHGLALRLDVHRSEAAVLLQRFLDMFPTLRAALHEGPQYGALRGFVSTVTGLRRHRPLGSGHLTNWDRNWMKNTPVQGSAADVFKAAGNRLDQLYQLHDAWLLVPVHDAYLFEAPLPVLVEVAELTARVLRDTVQEYFPVLRPQVEINIQHPECWNKDGHHDSVERWLENPLFKL